MTAETRGRRPSAKAEQAMATRVRIVDAATELFVSEGFLTTTMSGIAKHAGVAVQTLYLSFGSKASILKAVFDAALAGGDNADGILEQEWFQAVIDEPDGPTALRLFCANASEVIGRASLVFNVIRMAGADPKVAELLAENRQLRLGGYRLIRDALVTRPGYSPTLDPDVALGIMFAVVSEDTYLMLVHEYGWSHERWTEWITETIVSQLFPKENS
ncbi:TetR/AcrR family transcriptional regulator [Gordonia sp. VNK1]|uniref:TetR/AcrR family transcriptional regulator n=1 Tax=Gordonia oleivorans TaxID=3156618 RepID=UPI0032B37771